MAEPVVELSSAAIKDIEAAVEWYDSRSPRFGDVEDYDDGFFVFLHAGRNTYCTDAVAAYQALLDEQSSFVPWTLTQVHDALADHSSAEWLDLFRDRYLAFEKVEDRLGSRS